MLDVSSREQAKSLFDRNQKREAEIANALEQEKARHAAIVKNMHRLRELRWRRIQSRHRRLCAVANPPTVTSACAISVGQKLITCSLPSGTKPRPMPLIFV